MLLLITDTSGKEGFVALARAGETDPIHVLEEVQLTGGTFSAELVPQIASLLQKHGLQKTDIGAFIVISGPGSFTGLRVGLAAIKALAEILHKPIVPVSLLEVIALASGIKGHVLAALDAGRGEIYVGRYDVEDGIVRLREEQLLPKAEFLSRANHEKAVTRDVSVADAAKTAAVPIVQLEGSSTAMIARLGWQKLKAGNVVSPEQLEANYVGRRDAEIFSKPATSS